MKGSCAIITNDKKEILFIKRGREPFARHWALVSGIGESKKGLDPEQAILGEVMGDIKTPILDPKLIFVLLVPEDYGVDEIFVFSGSVDESSIQPNPPYTLDHIWCAPDDIPNLGKLAFEHTTIVQKFLEIK